MPMTKEQLRTDKDLLDDYFENQLLLLFKDSEQRCMVFRKKELWEKLGLINQYFSKIDFKQLEKKADKENILNLKEWMYKKFLERVYSLNDRKVKQTLNHLQNKGLIIFDEVMWKSTNKGHYAVTDENEISFILDCRIRAKLKAVGKYKTDRDGKYILDDKRNKIPTTFQDIRKNALIYKKYKKWLHTYLSENGIEYTYNKYKITLCSDKFIREAYEDNLVILCKKVNSKINLLIDNDADREQNNKYPNCKDYAKLQKWLSHQLIYIGIDFEDYIKSMCLDKDVVGDEDFDVSFAEFEKFLPWK